jgi:hypothetical protein
LSGDDNSLDAETKDGEAALFFIVMPAESMPAFSLDCAGTVEGQPVELGLL